MLTAVHHATDTLTHIAVADARCVRRAAADHRLYIPTRLLPEGYDIPYPYGPAPRSRVTALLDGYRLAVKTCTDATAALDALALAARAPSHVLTATHTSPAFSQPLRSAPSAPSDREQEKQVQDYLPFIPTNLAAWKRPCANCTSPSRPCWSAPPPSTKQPGTFSPKQLPKHATRPPATDRSVPGRPVPRAADHEPRTIHRHARSAGVSEDDGPVRGEDSASGSVSRTAPLLSRGGEQRGLQLVELAAKIRVCSHDLRGCGRGRSGNTCHLRAGPRTACALTTAVGGSGPGEVC